MKLMNIKCFIILSLLCLQSTEKTSACSGPPPTYNYYMFKVCPSTGNLTAMRQEALAKEWARYTRTNVTAEQIAALAEIAPEELDTIAHPIVAEARRRNDKEMMDYLKALTGYCRLNETSEYGWDYPTKEELAANRQHMETLYGQAVQYTGKRLAPHWQLLAVRTLFRMERWKDLIAYWQNTVSHQPHSVLPRYGGRILCRCDPPLREKRGGSSHLCRIRRYGKCHTLHGEASQPVVHPKCLPQQPRITAAQLYGADFRQQRTGDFGLPNRHDRRNRRGRMDENTKRGTHL